MKRTQTIHGEYLDMTFAENGDLTLTLSRSAREMEEEWREIAEKRGDFWVLEEMLEDFTGKGWDFLSGLDRLEYLAGDSFNCQDAPMLAEGVRIPEDTGYPFPVNSGRWYVHPQDLWIESRWPLGPGYVEQLYNRGGITWTWAGRCVTETPIVEACIALFTELEWRQREHGTLQAALVQATMRRIVDETGCDPVELAAKYGEWLTHNS